MQREMDQKLKDETEPYFEKADLKIVHNTAKDEALLKVCGMNDMLII